MKKLFWFLRKQIKNYFFKRTSVFLKNSINDFSKYSKINYTISGTNNSIFIHSGCILSKIEVIISGNNHSLIINKNCNLKNATFWFEDDNCEIFLGEGTTVEKGYFAVTEPNRKIYLGNDCMVSKDVSIRTGDSHSIIDLKTNKRINMGKDVIIGNHVWLGLNTSILKGVTIGNNSIIGNGTIVTGNVPDNSIVAGNPSRILKENISWVRERIYN